MEKDSSVKQRKAKRVVESHHSVREKVDNLKKSLMLVESPPYAFLDPCPTSMRHMTVREFSASEISWKMMTPYRPLDKNDENIFSRQVNKIGTLN